MRDGNGEKMGRKRHDDVVSAGTNTREGNLGGERERERVYKGLFLFFLFLEGVFKKIIYKYIYIFWEYERLETSTNLMSFYFLFEFSADQNINRSLGYW